MNPKDYGLAEQDFYQTEDKSLGLHRRALQTDLYILGLYIIKKYSSFAIFISEETFRSTNIQRNNERHRDYKGIYKYYFFVKSPRHREIGIAKHKYLQEAFFYEDFEWFRYVYSLEDMNQILGLLWGAEVSGLGKEIHKEWLPIIQEKMNEYLRFWIQQKELEQGRTSSQ